MKQVRLGRTELLVTKPAFGALPVQRVAKPEAVRLLQKAAEGGINFFDTANAYSDSEEKLGEAFGGRWDSLVVATKSGGGDYETVTRHIQESLRRLKTDCIDLFQFHNPAVLPRPEDPDGRYRAALDAQRKGYIRHIGITNHRLQVAKEAVESGLFESLQFPFSYLASPQEAALTKLCRERDVGFIAMKGLCGGLLNNARACHVYLDQFDNVAPIWGIQRESELQEWLALAQEAPALTPELDALIKKDRKDLAANFCRGCGYCLPCPAGIEIFTAARMSMLLRRAPYRPYLSRENYEKMHRIDDCIGCNHCKDHCPYGLDTPALLKEMLRDYDEFYAAHRGE